MAQSRFEKGFEVGYKEGWCYDKGVGCIPPIPPIAPIPGIGEDMNNYQDGYRRGFTMGQQDGKNKIHILIRLRGSVTKHLNLFL